MYWQLLKLSEVPKDLDAKIEGEIGLSKRSHFGTDWVHPAPPDDPLIVVDTHQIEDGPCEIRITAKGSDADTRAVAREIAEFFRRIYGSLLIKEIGPGFD